MIPVAAGAPPDRLGRLASHRPSLVVHDGRDDDSIWISSNFATYQLVRATGVICVAKACDGSNDPAAAVGPVRLTDGRGIGQSPRLESVRIVESTSERVVVEWTGSFPDVHELQLTTRWTWRAFSDAVLVEVRLHNPRRARHVGGLWDLGDAGSARFRDLSLDVTLSGMEAAWKIRPCPNSDIIDPQGGPIEIYQESSGGESWNSQNHVNSSGVVPFQLCGYRGLVGETTIAGRRAAPIVWGTAEDCIVAAAIPDFWQEFPKAVEACGNRLSLRLFPKQFADGFELQGGEQKTHRALFVIRHDGGRHAESEAVEALTVAGEQAKFGAMREPAQADRIANAFLLPGLPNMQAGDAAVLGRVDLLLAEFLDGKDGLKARRELVDEYGWRNYGDLHADHEEQHYQGSQPLVSHYNNQFDVLCGFLLQWRRIQDDKWLELAAPLARHVIDIDIYHTREDRPVYNGGLFWFTDHYLHAKTSTHRTYSRRNRPADGSPYGGGPGQEHNFTTGLLLFHFLTGSLDARAAVQSLADWVLQMDDGRLTRLGLVDDGPTGCASATSDLLYQGPGRGVGNSINALLDAWLLTSERRYLDYSEVLIRRCVHPAEDIDRLDLLNAEKRWSYTVFLTALAKYLDVKCAANQIDEAYGYAQASLVHYGRWMLKNERPYFERRENLQYPTEAWPSQELRKANALRLAALHVEEPLRSQMFDRGDELADRAWSDLMAFSTRAAVRAMAVVMVEGLRDAEFRARSAPRRPEYAGTLVLPPHETFLPQRERVKRRIKSPKSWPGLLSKLADPRRWARVRHPW